jgi:colicin import membrane protein
LVERIPTANKPSYIKTLF